LHTNNLTSLLLGVFVCVLILQDSGADGAGYETALKGGSIAVGKAGTKKVKAAQPTAPTHRFELF
jgi:hypothetical protein